jgi:MYXO-CTERM domain-containing protein
MVRPFLNNKFSRDQAGTLTGRVFAIAGLEQLTMTFLPEPAVATQAAFGILGLGALCARRIRRR